LWSAVPGLLLILGAAGRVGAQETAALSGRVTDRSTGKAVPSAEVIYLADSRAVTTDTGGRYAFKNLPAGVGQFLVRAPHFPALHIIVELAAGQEFVRPVALDSTPLGRLAAAQALPPVSVSAEAPVMNYRLIGFEQRKKNGHGQYLSEDDIVRSGAYNLADAVKHMRGVTYECGGGGGCFIRMARAPMQCLPEYIVDDQVMNDFGPLTPIRDIIAVELYTGPTEVPGEYAGRNSGCGVVVIWTRSGPPRKKK
jgi:hypothetical protein